MLQFLLTISDEANHDKIERIYEKYHNKMMKYALSHLKSAKRTNYMFDAEDVVQNCFLKITKYIDSIDFSRSEIEIKNYCFTVLNHEICNLLGDEEVMFVDFTNFCLNTEFNFVNDIEIRERYDEVVKAIEELDEKYSSTLYLVLCQEKTVNEIAEMMGISAQTVYSRISRGKRKLIDSLEGAKHNGK